VKKFVLFLACMLLAGMCWAGSVNRDSNIVSLSTFTATKVLGNRETRKAIVITNLDAATTVYFSNADISIVNWPATSIKTGVFALKAGQSFNEEGDTTYSREMYMVAQSSATANVNVSISERW
jgi:Flp pilus assembly protein CpaB